MPQKTKIFRTIFCVCILLVGLNTVASKAAALLIVESIKKSLEVKLPKGKSGENDECQLDE